MSHELQACRTIWAGRGLAEGFITLEEFESWMALTDVMGEMSLRRFRQWWAPRHDQMWRYE